MYRAGLHAGVCRGQLSGAREGDQAAHTDTGDLPTITKPVMLFTTQPVADMFVLIALSTIGCSTRLMVPVSVIDICHNRCAEQDK